MIEVEGITKPRDYPDHSEVPWSTEDDYRPVEARYALNHAMTSDVGGNVYAVGESNNDALNRGVAFIRQKPAGTDTWQTVGTVQTVNTYQPAGFDGVTVSPTTGNVYVSGWADRTGKVWKGTWNAGALSLAVVDSGLNYQDVAADPAGNVYAVGYYSVRKGNTSTQHWVVRKQTGGQGAFTTVDDFLFSGNTAIASAVTIVPTGTAAGVYVVGAGRSTTGNQWIVRKSTNAGATWSTVDTFQLHPTTKAPMSPREITAHEDGTVHVVGTAATGVRTGGTDKSPIYSYTSRWFLRSSSSNGGASWSNQDVSLEPAGSASGEPTSVTTDLAGNVYIAGNRYTSENVRATVRTNAGGSWATVDDYANQSEPLGGAYANCMTRDASGTLYIGGEHGTADSSFSSAFVRSMPSTPLATATVSSIAIASDAAADDDEAAIEHLLEHS